MKFVERKERPHTDYVSWNRFGEFQNLRITANLYLLYKSTSFREANILQRRRQWSEKSNKPKEHISDWDLWIEWTVFRL